MLGKELRETHEEDQQKGKWVKKLQQESWELELLVSGFSIVLLANLSHWLSDVIDGLELSLNMNNSLSVGVYFFLIIVLLANYALIINLIVHLIFRGFWVGIVGLGSVAPNTNFNKLKYSDFFSKKLEKRITKLDALVVQLDKISSLMFTFAFLIIFFLISIGLFMICLILFAQIANAVINNVSETVGNVVTTITVVLVLFYLFGGMIYMIDFLTLGWMKKRKIISKVYYPIYTFFGWITLSFLYRTLYYNLISKFTKRKVGLILIPYLLIIVMVPFFTFSHHIYYPKESQQSHIEDNYYRDQRPENEHIYKADIPSYIIKETFLPVFIAYSPNDNETIKRLNPDIETEINEGLNSTINIELHNSGLSFTNKKYKKPDKLLKCLLSMYKLYLNDSIIENPKFFFKTTSEKKDKGLFTVLDIKELERGEHHLKIKKVYFDYDQQKQMDFAFIPFWKE